MLLSAEHLSKNFGMRQLLTDATLYLDAGDRIGFVGLNGTGKSTLLRILAGAEPSDGGTITVQRNARIAYLPQNPAMQDNNTILEQIFEDFSSEFREIHEYEVCSMLNRLGIPDHTKTIGTLSGGQRKRVALAATLIQPADILILDEPTNHLDSEMTIWLEDRLRQFTGGLLMVTHDRYFLERVATKITELSHGKLYTCEANFSRYLEWKAERLQSAEASERKRQSLLRKETAWIMRGARARGTKSKERIARYQELKERTGPEYDSHVQMITVASRLGKQLIELKNVSKSFGNAKVLSDFSYIIGREDRIGIVGRNGAGKSTLLNLIAERLRPDSGSVLTGQTVRIGYFTQEGRELDPTMKVYDFIRGIASEVTTAEGTFSASQMLERFLFDGGMQHSLIGKLSGGERRRLYLLSILISAPNILLLDEPTNDLDIETLMILEDYLLSFPGAVITVSHDRYFLDKIATSIFEVGEGGQVTQYTGGFSDYLEKRPQPIAEEKSVARQPKEKAAPRPSQKLKLSFKEQKEIETIDDDIAALEQQVAECEAECESVSSDYLKLMEASQRLEELKAKLDEKTERWLYLTELVEKINAQ